MLRGAAMIHSFVEGRTGKQRSETLHGCSVAHAAAGAGAGGEGEAWRNLMRREVKGSFGGAFPRRIVARGRSMHAFSRREHCGEGEE
jgi:hypothetical protein